ncbi:hypothetical protein ATCC19606_36680 [Acinetobacter baumannii]|uniref:Uncharacterized protein n=1 Tax=Acinetobacter baumannii TaxID=470 RepID=A0A6F8TLP4_ACIBA|nr:hypothetical protein ATCC19606_36680 [Acinetobacter baumannii]
MIFNIKIKISIYLLLYYIHKYLYKYNNLIFNLYYFYIFLKIFTLELKIMMQLFKSKNLQRLGLCVSKLGIGEALI